MMHLSIFGRIDLALLAQVDCDQYRPMSVF